MKIGVLGGGISGLTFANKVESEVLEMEKTVGGLMRSAKEDGYTFDMGSHIIFSKNQEVLKYMLDVLGDNKLTHRRNTKIFYKGIKVKYPFENGLGDLPKEEAMECYNDYKEIYDKREGSELSKPKNFKEWMYYRFGKGITEKYLYPYNNKVWDYPTEKMDIFWVEGRVPQPPIEDVKKAAMGMESEGYTHQLNFYYPNYGGIETVSNAISKQIDQKKIITNFKINKIKKEGDNWVVKGPEEKIYDKIVNTIHVRDFIHAYDGAPENVKNAVDNLKWNSIYLVMIGLETPKLNDIHWAYIPDKERLPNRISFPGNMSPNTVPKGHSSVLAEITFRPDGEKAKFSKSEIIERTIDDLHDIKVIDKKQVVFKKLVTCKYAYVVYDLDYLENIKIIEDFAKSEGITLLGRFSEFRYYNSDKCIESAFEKAKLFA
ncbi:MAG: FAD-dependent oxidoreductase [Candidatus Micrarchaeota archaeon]